MFRQGFTLFLIAQEVRIMGSSGSLLYYLNITTFYAILSAD